MGEAVLHSSNRFGSRSCMRVRGGTIAARKGLTRVETRVVGGTPSPSLLPGSRGGSFAGECLGHRGNILLSYDRKSQAKRLLFPRRTSPVIVTANILRCCRPKAEARAQEGRVTTVPRLFTRPSPPTAASYRLPAKTLDCLRKESKVTTKRDKAGGTQTVTQP